MLVHACRRVHGCTSAAPSRTAALRSTVASPVLVSTRWRQPELTGCRTVINWKPPRRQTHPWQAWLWLKFRRYRWYSEKKGDSLISFANVLQLAGFACTDPIQLKSANAVGLTAFALFYITRMPMLTVGFYWSVLKGLTCLWSIHKIVMSRQPVKFTREELQVYEEHFFPFGISQRQFKSFWDIGDSRTLVQGEVLAREGEAQESLSIITSGWVSRTRAGQFIPSLDTRPELRRKNREQREDGTSRQTRTPSMNMQEGDAGAWVGEIVLLRMIDCKNTSIVIVDADADDLHKALSEMDNFDDVSAPDEYDMDNYGQEHQMELLARKWAGEDKEAEDVDDIDGKGARVHGKEDSYFTVIAREETEVREWFLDDVMDLCKKNPEMRGMFRKACSQSVINKAKTLMVDEAAPEGAGKSREPAPQGASEDHVRRYALALRLALKWQEAMPDDKVALWRFRTETRISPLQHAAALKAAVGWTPEEYEHGAPFARVGTCENSAALRILSGGLP